MAEQKDPAKQIGKFERKQDGPYLNSKLSRRRCNVWTGDSASLDPESAGMGDQDGTDSKGTPDLPSK